MNELYDYLRLNKENALDIPVSANVIAEHVKSRKKKTALEAELSNVSKILEQLLFDLICLHKNEEGIKISTIFASNSHPPIEPNQIFL